VNVVVILVLQKTDFFLWVSLGILQALALTQTFSAIKDLKTDSYVAIKNLKRSSTSTPSGHAKDYFAQARQTLDGISSELNWNVGRATVGTNTWV